MKKIFIFLFISFFYTTTVNSNTNNEELYKKIDLFAEVLEKIRKEYVDEVDQSELIDNAINGALQSLDPYSAYMTPELFDSMQTDTKGEFGGLGIEVGMEAGVVKVIAPIDDTPAAKAGIKAGDYIVKIDDIQVQGKSLMEAVKLMRGPVGSTIELTIRRKGKRKQLTGYRVEKRRCPGMQMSMQQNQINPGMPTQQGLQMGMRPGTSGTPTQQGPTLLPQSRRHG